MKQTILTALIILDPSIAMWESYHHFHFNTLREKDIQMLGLTTHKL